MQKARLLSNSCNNFTTNHRRNSMRASDKMNNSKICKITIFISIVLTCFFFGHHLSIATDFGDAIKDMFNQTYHERYGEPISSSKLDQLLNLNSAMFFLAAILGSLSVTTALRYLSRTQAMIGLHLFVIVGSLIKALGAGLSGSYEAYIIGSLITGYGIGLSIPTVSVIIGELSVYQHLTFYTTVMGFGYAYADFNESWISLSKILGGSKLWPIMVAFSILTSLYYVLVLKYISETPYEILNRVGRDKAKELLRKLRAAEQNEDFEEALENEIQTMERDANVKKVGKSSLCGHLSFKDVITTTHYREQLLRVIAIYGFTMLCGINTIFGYFGDIYQSAGIPQDKFYLTTIGIMSILLIGSITGVLLVKRYGERKILLLTTGMIIIALLLIIIGVSTMHLRKSMAIFTIIFIVIMFFGFACGPTILMFSLGVSLTTKHTRPAILSLASALYWFSAWLVGFVGPYLQTATGAYGLFFWLGSSIIFMIYFWYSIPETKDRTSDEIQRTIY